MDSREPREDRELAADYSEQALADRCIDFLEERADAWMAESGVQRMFNAIASVFEKYAPQEIMDRFREKLGVIGRQCHVEGALRVWEEIAAQQRALGRPLPASAEAIRRPSPVAESTPTDATVVEAERLTEAQRRKIVDQIVPDLNNIARAIEDEGDRAYFGSSNDADELRSIADQMETIFRRTPKES